MKFLIDAQLPPQLAGWLRARGHEAAAVRDAGLRDASDGEIWNHAIMVGAAIITKDTDFAQLAVQHDNAPAVLWVRCGNVVNRVLLGRFEVALPEILEHFNAGSRLVELR